ncbi:MAG: RecQ family ATP-dependent DNA helicase, partial [Catalinimonas sp.]
MDAPDLHHILKQYWGYDRFRPLQEEIIRSVLGGRDTLALLPTGGGKSVCFQVPALARDGLCLVVSPLIALMKDQVEQLRRRRVPAYALYSGIHPREIDVTLDNCVWGRAKFLYVSPERLQTDLLRERLKKMRVNLLAVDEAHCVSQWGYDFRPPYLEIGAFRDEFLADVPCVALTATATPAVRDDIADKLHLRDPAAFRKSFARANLSYSCFEEEDKRRRLLQILRNVPGTSVVYVRNRRRTREVAENLRQHQITADFYHAGLSVEERGRRQDAWLHNRTRVMVATNAFGMGIDKPDVRTVVHLDLPDSLEAYYQEAGRAGRDQKKAYAVALYDGQDLHELDRRAGQAYPAPEVLRRVYQALANYCKVAVGSSELASYELDLGAFQKAYQLPPVETYHALKRLEQEGLLQFNESFHQPSRLWLQVDNKSLYEFQVAHRHLDTVIKLLLRAYGGELFGQFVNVDERQIAHHLRTEVPTVQKLLAGLQAQGVAVYEPRSDRPR